MNIQFGNDPKTSRNHRAYQKALDIGLLTTDDSNVLVVTFSDTQFHNLMVTEVEDLKVIHDSYDSVVRNAGRIRVTKWGHDADEFIYTGRGIIEENW